MFLFSVFLNLKDFWRCLTYFSPLYLLHWAFPKLSLVTIMAAICCAITGSWGSTFMSDWIGRQSPQILSRVDEDDVELWHYMHYTTGLYIVLTCCSYSLYCRITTSIHYLKRFGRHPEDWEKGKHGDPNMLTRELDQHQSTAVRDLELKMREQTTTSELRGALKRCGRCCCVLKVWGVVVLMCCCCFFGVFCCTDVLLLFFGGLLLCCGVCCGGGCCGVVVLS
jgi:hypothetical protein